MPTQAFALTGMHCQACVERISASLRKIPGVESARVTLTPPQAEIESNATITKDRLADAVRSAGDYSLGEVTHISHSQHDDTAAPPKPSIYPLVLIVLYIAGTVALATYFRGQWSWHTFINDFMAGFFLGFSFFKLLDLRGFADAYQSYDIVARRFRGWAVAYPFVELALGIAFLVRWNPILTNWLTLVIMLIGSVGVLRALHRKSAIRCACLGTALNLPMTTVTLVEDLGMAAMAAVILLWQ